MPKSREPCLVFWIVLGEASHHADVSPLIGRLGAGGTRHRYRYTGDKRDEFAAPHVPLTPSIRTLPHRCRECRIVHHSRNWPPMAEMGQTRPFCDVCLMSGLPPKAAVQRTSVDVAKVPIAS
jgi:hypothetical protein